MPPLRPALAGALLLALPFALTACGDSTEPSNDGDDPARAALTVVTSTTGLDRDTDGFTVGIGAVLRDVRSTDSVTVVGLAPGSARVELHQVRDNCAVEGGNTVNVTLVAGDTARAVFDVACVQRTGAVTVILGQTGRVPDPDGYTVAVAGRAPVPVAAGGSVTLTDIPVGTYPVAIADRAPNCHVLSAPDANVQFGTRITILARVECAGPLSGRLVVARSLRGGPTDVLSLEPDGSGLEIVRPGDDPPLLRGAISRDGTILAGRRSSPVAGGIWVMHPDGSGLRGVPVIGQQGIVGVRWVAPSPDGMRIAFGADTDAEGRRIWIVNVDGTGLRQLTDIAWSDFATILHDDGPTWSPTGDRIAFVRNEADLFIINADGSGLYEPMPGTRVLQAAWSPVDDRIAFRGWEGPLLPQLYMVNADGSGKTGPLTDRPDGVGWPIWSPDGTQLAHAWGGVLEVLPAAGGPATRVPLEAQTIHWYAWAP